MDCPACKAIGKNGGSTIYRCDNCGDVRCSESGCPGTMGGMPFSAVPHMACNACRKGKYVKIS